MKIGQGVPDSGFDKAMPFETANQQNSAAFDLNRLLTDQTVNPSRSPEAALQTNYDVQDEMLRASDSTQDTVELLDWVYQMPFPLTLPEENTETSGILAMPEENTETAGISAMPETMEWDAPAAEAHIENSPDPSQPNAQNDLNLIEESKRIESLNQRNPLKTDMPTPLELQLSDDIPNNRPATKTSDATAIRTTQIQTENAAASQKMNASTLGGENFSDWEQDPLTASRNSSPPPDDSMPFKATLSELHTKAKQLTARMENPEQPETTPKIPNQPNLLESRIPMNEQNLSQASHNPSTQVSNQNQQPLETTINQITQWMNQQGASDNRLETRRTNAQASTPQMLKFQLATPNPETVLRSSYSLNQHSAKISVHPEELGTITANIQFHEGKAALILSADHQQVRSFLESNLHQLRETFQEAHIQLDQASVQHQNTQDQGKQQQSDRQQLERHGQPKAEQLVETEPKNARSNTMIDTYA